VNFQRRTKERLKSYLLILKHKFSKLSKYILRIIGEKATKQKIDTEYINMYLFLLCLGIYSVIASKDFQDQIAYKFVCN